MRPCGTKANEKNGFVLVSDTVSQILLSLVLRGHFLPSKKTTELLPNILTSSQASFFSSGMTFCVGYKWQGFSSGGPAGVASVGGGQGLPCAAHRRFKPAQQGIHYIPKLSKSEEFVVLL